MKKYVKAITIFLFSGALFFMFTVISHKFLAVFTLTEVRLSAVLYPFLGVSFGLPAALGIMVSNFLSDAVNGYSPMVLLTGLLPQILYSMVPYFIWRYFVRNDVHKHRLDSVKRVLQFAFVCFVSAFLAGGFVGFFCNIFYNLDFLQVAKFTFLNNFIISIMFGCPLMIVVNQIISREKGHDRTVSTNEKIIIAAAIVEVIALFILIFKMYTNAKMKGTYEIWNTIYNYIIMLIIFIFIITLIVMIVFEQTFKKKQI